jgi:hypothetical protein
MKHWVQYHDPDTRGRVAEEVSPMMTTIGEKIQEPAGSTPARPSAEGEGAVLRNLFRQ